MPVGAVGAPAPLASPSSRPYGAPPTRRRRRIVGPVTNPTERLTERLTERVVAAPPPPGTAVPPAVRRLVDEPEAVWLNQLGGLTFRDGDRFVKWSPAGTVDLRDEAARTRWVGAYATVPEVLDEGRDEDGSWLVTRALPGRSAIDAPWRDDPAAAVRAIGAGLRRWHDAVPVDRCPYTWAVEDRLTRADDAAEAAALRDAVPPLDLVVCHGDACAPNTLVDDDGRFVGHVDAGSLGVADRWADLAVATWSLEWNFGPGWDRPLLEAYGIDPDEAKTGFYRRVWDAT